MVILAAAWIGFATLSSADDTIPIKDLPKAVLSTITRRYPKAELTEARKTLEDKAVIYEVDLTNDKIEIEIAVHENGSIDWVAVDLPIANLPKPVLMAVRKKYPAATLNHASTVYTVKNGKDQLEHYYVEITTKAGKDRGLDVLPKGEIEEDEEIED
jgi:hypothetical protein